jgi:hypothetical protein
VRVSPEDHNVVEASSLHRRQAVFSESGQHRPVGPNRISMLRILPEQSLLVDVCFAAGLACLSLRQ